MRIFCLLIAALPALAQNVSPFAPPPFATDPAACYVGQLYINTATSTYKQCSATNTWTPFVRGPASSVNGNVPQFSGTTGGVLTGGLPVATVATANALVETNGSGLIDPSFITSSSGSFGAICHATITTTAGQSTIGSTCTLGSSYIQVFLNGTLLTVGSGNDYTISGNNVVMDSTNYSGGLAAGQKITVVQ
jgi:hypothetical protein